MKSVSKPAANPLSNISQLLTFRKLTRAVADQLSDELKSHLVTLGPLLNPRGVFGQHMRSATKQSVKGDTEAFEQLKRLYLQLAGSPPYNLRKEVESTLDIVGVAPEISPAEYAYDIPDGDKTKTIAITSPLKWVLTFSGNSPKRLRELLANQKAIVGTELQQCVLNFLIMHVTLANRPGVTKLLEALRFRVSTGNSPEFGDLPLVFIEAPITTVLAPDEVILQNTEISGTPAFEEVLLVDSIHSMTDPLQDQLLALVAK